MDAITSETGYLRFGTDLVFPSINIIGLILDLFESILLVLLPVKGII